MDKFLIIVAGGKGSRMLSETPKQFHTVAGKPILMHTVNCFFTFQPTIKIILVLPEPFIDFWKSLVNRYDFEVPHQMVVGGETRYESVKNGLKLVNPGSLVAIHDGVRPLVSHDTIKRVFDTTEEKGNAIPVISINESIRKVDGTLNIPVDRNDFFLVQTPQCFRSDILIKAYELVSGENFTDDATLVEQSGVTINLVEGNFENIKITRLIDLKIAEALLS